MKLAPSLLLSSVTIFSSLPAHSQSAFQILMPDAFVGTSGVILYGVADAGVQYYHAGSNSVFQAESGAGATSRIGFLGVEQLGNGLSVRFNLESALKLTNGTAGATTMQGDQSFFSREANVSLVSTQWGRIKLGRQYPTELSTAIDPFAGVGAFSPLASIVSLSSDLGKAATIGDSRISNAISYTTPIIGGFQIEILDAPRGVTTEGYPSASFQGAQIEYANGPLYLGAFYDKITTDPTSTTPAVKNKWLGAGAMYNLNGALITYEYNMTIPEYAGYYIASSHMIGLNIPQGLNTVKFSAIYRNVAGKDAANSLAIALGYDYNLSKTTALYARVGYVVNQKNAIGSLAGATLSRPGDDVSVVAVGIRKRF
ncbi:putative porin [Paraburkholderia sp. BL27I4N3]|uniref:porin n=1 Tax=Paraburkholderia sp. BL27I4N3 TaxID=1938805 RepID=UPI000E2509B7|nr:porin [Paraburkholderia sp. BL27I4N3]REE07362.1 putative porin [Paraburkholderia sp. BL27I4N3]